MNITQHRSVSNSIRGTIIVSRVSQFNFQCFPHHTHNIISSLVACIYRDYGAAGWTLSP
jgi:hypothetical protein